MQFKILLAMKQHVIKNNTSGYETICDKKQSVKKYKYLNVSSLSVPYQFALRVREFLNEKFATKWTGRGGPLFWPPRSPHLTHVDVF